MSQLLPSTALQNFLSAQLKNTGLVTVLSILVANVDVVEKALESNEFENDPMRDWFKKGWGSFRENVTPQEFLRMWREIHVSRTCDAFDVYLSRILMQIFTERPETLRTSDQVTVREVLECGDMSEFIQRAADKKVLDLSFKGLPAIARYLRTNLGVNIDETTSEFVSACEYIEVRNIIVHNAGLVSNLFLQRTGRTDLHVGELFPLPTEYVLSGANNLVIVAENLDREFAGHFNLSTEQSRGAQQRPKKP